MKVLQLCLLPQLILRCSSNSASAPASGGSCLTNGTVVSILGNHGHVLVVPIADVNSGFAKSYSILGSAGHDHVLTLTANDFANLKVNNGVSEITTVTSGHTHTITVTCA